MSIRKNVYSGERNPVWQWFLDTWDTLAFIFIGILAIAGIVVGIVLANNYSNMQVQHFKKHCEAAGGTYMLAGKKGDSDRSRLCLKKGQESAYLKDVHS